MAANRESNPSFSPFRKVVIALNVTLIIAVVFAVVVMVNYLSRDYFLRMHVNTQNRVKLFPRTVKFLQTVTNSVKVTLYYDKEDPFYGTILELLNEYRALNPKISIRVVDYRRDPGAAQLLRTNRNYASLGLANAKNLIIFDGGEGRMKFVDGNALVQYATKQALNENKIEFTRKPTLFEGERAFTSALIVATSAKPFKAYVLTGHGEHRVDDDNEMYGYKTFATLLRSENYIEVDSLSLVGTNLLDPASCNLLIIPGPVHALEKPELDAIDQYLNQGGRILALFNELSLKNGDTGLEAVLAKWGVNVTTDIVTDPERHVGEQDVIVASFSNHPIVTPLAGYQLHMILPRAISKLPTHGPATEAPSVEEIAFSGPRSFVHGDEKSARRAYPLMVAVEKGGVKGVINERGTTRIVVVGDSIFLANHQIESAANRDFVALAVNWLLDRPQLVEGIGPQAVTEYRLVMTNSQLQGAQWILLAGMPGAVLLMGGIVWLRRRS
jgi:ABC-2 type transport system permease protein